MLGTATGKEASLTTSRAASRRTGKIASRKIWLPRLLYDALPLFYILSGTVAFLTTLYISEWFWVLPHYLLFSVACLHLGVFVYRCRRRSRDDA